ncbi:736_t:CDS:1, partial [Gigaspora rosea]
MKENSVKINRKDVKNLWKQGYRSPTEISRKTNVPLRSCERYVAQLRKNGKISDIHRS